MTLDNGAYVKAACCAIALVAVLAAPFYLTFTEAMVAAVVVYTAVLVYAIWQSNAR